MKKRINYLLVVGAAAIIFVGVLLWVLKLTMEDDFTWYEAHYTLYIVLGGPGLVCFAAMAVNKIRLWGYIGLVSFVAAIVVAACFGDLKWEVVVPFGVLILAGLILYFVVFGLPKWDKGDNQKAGYKTYAERKAEAAAKAEDDAKEK